MSSQEHYSLRWNNHQSHILRAFDTLLQTKTLVDVTLVCAETSIRAHKVVLSACSPFFQRVFSETPCKHPVIVLKDFRGWVVQAIVDFMYRGEISVPQERLQTLIQAGESLQVRGLVDHPVAGNTPTPAASPDDFGLMDTSMISPESPASSTQFEGSSLLTAGNKLLLPPHVYVDSSGNLQSQPDICTSPMPRRKQARPRRRSGECAPHDLSSKPTTPIPSHINMRTSSACDDRDGPDEEKHQPPDDDDDDNHDNDSIHNDLNDNDASSSAASIEGPENLCTKNSKSGGSGSAGDGSIDKSQKNRSSDATNNNNNNNISNSNNSSNNNNNNNNNNHNNNNNNNNNRIVLSLKDIRHLNRAPSLTRPPQMGQPVQSGSSLPPSHQLSGMAHSPSGPHHPMNFNSHHARLNAMNHHAMDSGMKLEMSEDSRHEADSPPIMEQMDLTLSHHGLHSGGSASHRDIRGSSLGGSGGGNDSIDLDRNHHHHNNNNNKEFLPTSPMNLPPHFNPHEGPPHPPSPLPFPQMPSVSSLALTPPHIFGLDSPLGLFPHGIDPGKLYSPLMEMSDPRGMHHEPPSFLKKKMNRPKGQHSAPRGGPPRSWTNAELTEALQHVWNKKMTTSQASRIFGIPYNSLLMYVRGKYGKSLKLEQLRKDCISGPPIELLTMGMTGNNNNSKGMNQSKEMKDIENHSAPRSSSSEPDLLSSPNPLFNPFPPGFYPDFPGGFPGLPLSMLNLLPPDRQPPPLPINIDEDCKSDRSKQSLDDDFSNQPLALNRDDRREILNGQD